MEEYLELLRDINESGIELRRIGCEAMELIDVSDRYCELALSMKNPQNSQDWPSIDFVGNESLISNLSLGFSFAKKSLISAGFSPAKIALLGAAAAFSVGSYIYVMHSGGKWIQHIRSFSYKSQKGVDYFEKNIKPFGTHISENDFQSKKAKLLTTDQYQHLMKVTNELNELISKSFNSIKTDLIVPHSISIPGLLVKSKTDKHGVETIKKVTFDGSFKPKRMSISESGWDVAKVFQMFDVIKTLLRTLESYQRYDAIIKKQIDFVKAKGKSIKKDPLKYPAALEELVTVKQNLKNLTPIFHIFSKCVTTLTGQAFTLSSRIKVKKLEQ